MQSITELRNYCNQQKGSVETFPFDVQTLVFKVSNKMYALADIDTDPVKVSLKCDPARALLLRMQYPSHIVAGYHLNKNHWNTITLDGTLPEPLIHELIDHSYSLVVAKLTKAERAVLE